MKTLGIIAQKGGNGKTTTGLALAVCAAESLKTTAVIDLDPQTSAANWGDRREKEAPAVVSCQVSRLRHVLEGAAAQGVELAILDTPGKSTEAAVAAARASDLVLIPVRPQMFDIETLPTIRDILKLAGDPKHLIVITAAPIQGKRHLETMEAVQGMGFQVCPVVIFQRQAHADATNVGQGVTEYDPASKAAAEVKELYAYIASVL